MARLIVKNVKELEAWIGTEFGISDWYQITQTQINQFADSTGDHQWIHLDAEKCRTDSPFKKPIAHGYLILSLVPKFFYECIQFENADLTINYGLNKVRFTHPVVVDSFVRAKFILKELKEMPGGVRLFTDSVFEIQDVEKPACLAESILQIVWSD